MLSESFVVFIFQLFFYSIMMPMNDHILGKIREYLELGHEHRGMGPLRMLQRDLEDIRKGWE